MNMRTKMKTNKYFIIGDIHGCYDELMELIDGVEPDREIISVGDLTDRGPASDKVLVWVLENGIRFSLGNHDDKLIRCLNGNSVTISHGLDLTLEQIKNNKADEQYILDNLLTLPMNYYLELDEGKLIIVHASYYVSSDRSMRGEERGHVSRNKALYGFTTGARDSNGYPVRIDWAEAYRGSQVVVHGHVVVDEVLSKNNVWNIDTGCVFGGKLTGLNYPEMTLKSVQAKKIYSPKR